MFDDLATLLHSHNVRFDGRDFADYAWLENEQTRDDLYERAFEIMMVVIDDKQRDAIPNNVDYKSIFALGRACAQFLDERNRGMESPIASLALHKYIEQLVENGKPDVFFEQQCRLQLITADLLINYTTFREAIAADGIPEETIRERYRDHAGKWAHNITQLIETIQLIGNHEQPLNFETEENANTIFDYSICLAQSVRSMILQFTFMKPILDYETANEIFKLTIPLSVKAIETLAPHREKTSPQYIMFQTLTAQMGIFMEKETGNGLPIEHLFGQCNIATSPFDDLSPIDSYSTLFAHILRVDLCAHQEELHPHLEQAKADAARALEASQQNGNYNAYQHILGQLLNGEPINHIIASDELAHSW